MVPRRKASPEGNPGNDRKGAASVTGTDDGPFVGGAKSAWEEAGSQQFNTRREAVVVVASVLFEERGYAGVSLADIAGELGITNNALYYYFTNKEEFAYICSARAQARIDGYLDKAEATDGTGLERLETFITALLTDAHDGPPLPLRMYYALSRKVRAAVLEQDRNQRERLLRIMQEGIVDGSIVAVEAPLTVDFILGGWYSMHRRCQRSTAHVAEVTEVVPSILRGIAVDPWLGSGRRGGPRAAKGSRP